MKLGYTLSSEEFTASTLIQNAQKAEEFGFDFIGISDHFHPWAEAQGQSPFVWTTLGGISQVTNKIEVLVEVTCPIIRYHPVIIAQASATTATLLEGRFSLGVGAGENLNEHVVGKGWPSVKERHERLKEAVSIIRMLWSGEVVNFQGRFYQVDSARLYSLPKHVPPIIVSAYGQNAAKISAEVGDGLVTVAPNKSLIDKYISLLKENKPIYGQINVCFAQTTDEAKQVVFEYWPNAAAPGDLSTELRLPEQFEQVAKAVSLGKTAGKIPLGNKIEDFIKAFQTYKEAGFTHVYFHQIGPKQHEFMQFFKAKLKPAISSIIE